jgi:hypothetical protein
LQLQKDFSGEGSNDKAPKFRDGVILKNVMRGRRFQEMPDGMFNILPSPAYS